MTLDLSKVASQVQAMAAQLKEEKSGRERLELALKTLRAQASELNTLKSRIGSGKITWLVAGLLDELDRSYPCPLLPSDYAALATDGSHIDVDRHSPVKCFLVNIGSVLLEYGKSPRAVLGSEPFLCFESEDMTIFDPSSANYEEVEGALLGIKRTVLECQALARLAEAEALQLPTLAILDGSLVLWGLGGRGVNEYVRRALLEEGFLEALDSLRKLAQGKRFAIASYISLPRSTEVVNALRVACCPYEPVNCDRHCYGKHFPGRECDKGFGVVDRDLFDQVLGPGERSPLFLSSSSIQQYYGEHRVYFFYLKVEEIDTLLLSWGSSL